MFHHVHNHVCAGTCVCVCVSWTDLSVVALGSDLLTKYSLFFALMINSFADEQSCQMWSLKLSIKVRQSGWIHLHPLHLFPGCVLKSHI